MRGDFVGEVARVLKITRRDLIEKDLILHQILLDLSRDRFFASNFVFKGGTCLIKSYLGYFRFSEDIDFTWKNQRLFAGRSQKQIRGHLSKVIDDTGGVFEGIAPRIGLDFRVEKGNARYMELGGSNKLCTFKLWYDSEVLKRQTFFKVQINFVEGLCFRPTKVELRSLLSSAHAVPLRLFPEHAGYGTSALMNVYDIREILSEKVRAILTREGTKARDFLDVYLIQEKLGIKPEAVHECILRKTRSALKLYSKYRENFEEKAKLLQSGRLFEWGEERGLLLEEIDEKDFYSWLVGFEAFLKGVLAELDSHL